MPMVQWLTNWYPYNRILDHFQKSLDYSCNCPGTPNYIEPGTPCDDGNPFTINDVEDGFCNCAGSTIPYCGQVKNPSFTESLARWRYWGIEAESINEEAAITVLNIDDAGFGYEPLEVMENKSYTLKFDAYALEDRTIDIFLTGEFDFENCDLATLDDDLDQDGFTLANDCDDSNPDINPNQSEVPYNGLDDDCDATTLDDDLDQDGFVLADDCDDANFNINPNAEEVPNNNVDENCDGIDLVTSSHDTLNETIKIYPNPAVEIVNIEVSEHMNYRANLYTLEGKLIISESNTKQINVSTFVPGMYILEIINHKTNQIMLNKIIVNK